MDAAIAQFVDITSAPNERAAQYLQVADGDVEQAIQLYFENGGADMAAPPPPAPSTRPPPAGSGNPTGPITIGSDDEEQNSSGEVNLGGGAGGEVEDDEAMARRLQNEMYGSAGASGSVGADIDPETGVRAPIGRTAETLAGPTAGWQDDPDEMRAAIAEQIASRNARRQGRPGIFNQQPHPSASIWDEQSSSTDPSSRRQELSRATGGASDNSSKSSMLAEMYRPPTEIISPIRTWEGVRAYGKEEEKWILINVQDPNIFDCQVLNRDIWKDASVQATVREHFVFKQYSKSDPQAQSYVRFYFHSVDSEDAYPHIAIVDPRTGEQVKVWSGSPAPKAGEFLQQLHEFLDRYSLKAYARNPVATRKAEGKKTKDVGRMSEDEMMEMAMQQSLSGQRKGSGPREADPDSLTRDAEMRDAAATASGAGPSTSTSNTADAAASSVQPPNPTNGHTADPTTTTSTNPIFTAIPTTNPHTEPAPSDPDTTRIQFRHPNGRVIRRFALSDPVARIYEWLKAAQPSPLGEGNEGRPFELKTKVGDRMWDLLEMVEQGKEVGESGLRNGTVMVEFLDG